MTVYVIPLEPANTEIRLIRNFMVARKEPAQGDEVQWKRVLTFIVVVEVLVAIAMPAPVHNCAMDGSH